MIRNYITVALRNITRHTSYSLINVLGLGLGMACALLIFALVSHHLSYDTFHPEIDRAYRVVTEQHRDQISYTGSVPSALGKTLREEYTFTEKIGRQAVFGDQLVTVVSKNGEVNAIAREAMANGAKVDVGYGSHFSFKMARIALDAGITPDTLGADMHGYNTKVPKPAGTPDEHPDKDHMFAGATRFSLVSGMTAMLALGLSLEHVVAMATTNCAAMVGMKDLIGTLQPGVEADVTVLNDERGRWTLRDNEGTELVAQRMLTPACCLRAGVRFDADATILPVPSSLSDFVA